MWRLIKSSTYISSHKIKFGYKIHWTNNSNIRGVQRPASTDPPARNRLNRRSTGGSKSIYGWSWIGKKTTRIVRFGSRFKNISPEEPELTELFIIKKKKVDLTFQWFSLSLPEQPMPCPARDSKLTPSQHEH